MRRWNPILCGCALLLAGSAGAAEKIAPTTLEFLQATTISGYVQPSFQYTADSNGNPGQAGGRQFNNSGSDFSINQVKIALEHPLRSAEFAAGYRVDFLAGQDAQRIHSFGLFSSDPNELSRRQGIGASAESVDLEQAYVAFRIPVGEGLEVKVGKFVSLAGAESIDAPANWFFSHSYIFSFGEPFTHTGALFSYKWNDWLESQFAIVNGWDDVTDNNSAKSFIGRTGISLFDEKLKNAVTVIGGPEQSGNNSNYRWIVDDVLTWQPKMENLLFTVNGMYGHENGMIDSGGYFHSGGFEWWGVAAAARYQWTPFVSTALRYEYFSDADGARTGGMRGGLMSTSGPQTLHGTDYQAVTWSIWMEKLIPSLTPRLEVRWDHANDPLFRPHASGADGENSQLTVSFDLIYVF